MFQFTHVDLPLFFCIVKYVSRFTDIYVKYIHFEPEKLHDFITINHHHKHTSSPINQPYIHSNMSCIEWANKTVGGAPATECMVREPCPHPLTDGGTLYASPPAWLPPHCFPVSSGLAASVMAHAREIVSSTGTASEMAHVRGGQSLVDPH